MVPERSIYACSNHKDRLHLLLSRRPSTSRMDDRLDLNRSSQKSLLGGMKNGLDILAHLRVANGMSHTIDPRRPWRLSSSQLAEIDRCPEVFELESKLKQLRCQKRLLCKAKQVSLAIERQQAY